MKKLKRMIAAIAIGLASMAGAATAQDITIATGKAGGGYDRAAQTIGTRLAQRGWLCHHRLEHERLRGNLAHRVP